MAKADAKFYCETCGAEVAAGSNRCKSCGSRFYGVQCPRCAYSGPSALFVKGCPSCGYLAPVETGSIIRSTPEDEGPKEEYRGLPFWFYPLTIGVLLLLLVFLTLLFIRL